MDCLHVYEWFQTSIRSDFAIILMQNWLKIKTANVYNYMTEIWEIRSFMSVSVYRNHHFLCRVVCIFLLSIRLPGVLQFQNGICSWWVETFYWLFEKKSEARLLHNVNKHASMPVYFEPDLIERMYCISEIRAEKNTKSKTLFSL